MPSTGERPLHVVQIGFHLDDQARSPAQLLNDWRTLVDVADAAAQTGMRVSVIQACTQTDFIRRGEVDYHFIEGQTGRGGIARTIQFAQLIRRLSPDIFHIHGLDTPTDVLALAQLAHATPIFAQDHASVVPRLWRRWAWTRCASVLSGIAFCTLEQAQPFLRAGLIGARTTVYEIPECPSRFTPGDRDEARRATGIHGDPCVLWVGHLSDNKDPLTVLKGLSKAASHLPDMHLWCCFASAPLLLQMRHRIDDDPRLAKKVHLLGYVPHDRIEQLMRAADVFVAGSHREGSGYSVIEATACGLPPVVTDIASFRALTAGGAIGALWPCGNADRFAEKFLSVAARPRRELRARVRSHFEKELSLQAVGRKLEAAYREVIESRVSRRRTLQSC